MNRNLKDSFITGARNLPTRRGVSKDGDENIDLFSRNRRSLSVASSDESDMSVKLGRLSVGSLKQTKSGLDDLMSANEGGKHDYDWLLTPPGTPLFPAPDASESQASAPVARRSSSVSRSSTTKVSRLSVSHSESIQTSRPARSSSVTRPSVSTTQYSSSSYSRNPSSVLNTSSASVSSYIRPSTPTSRSSSAARPSTASSRAPPSRSSTPSRARPGPAPPSTDKTRPSQNSRPSTPNSRPQVPANLTSPVIRSNSRPSTPTRRSSAPSLSSSPSPSISTSRPMSSSGRTPSRPSSPSPRVRPPPQPIVPTDFSLDTPPNLRTTLPDRPISAGRSRPGAALTVKGNVDTPTSNNINTNNNVPRRSPSPIASRGRQVEPSGRSRVHNTNGGGDTMESRRVAHLPDPPVRKPVKPSPTDSNGFGRNISKKSLDMAIRHMDIRNGGNGIRPHSGAAIFPQSIRSSNAKTPPTRALSSPILNGNSPTSNNYGIYENGNYTNRSTENVNLEARNPYSARLTEVDMYESSRYDAILLKEDLKNTNWLHSTDEKSDQGSFFENGFELLPEPFAPL